MDLQGVRCGSMDWIELAQDRDRLRWIFKKWDVGGMDWIELAQERNKWRELVNL